MASRSDIATKTFEGTEDYNLEWETDKAYLFRSKAEVDKSAWVPKSQCIVETDGSIRVRAGLLKLKLKPDQNRAGK